MEFFEHSIFNLMFQNSQDLIVVVKPDDFFLMINPTFYKILGYNDKEDLDIKNNNFLDFVHSDDRNIAFIEREKVIKSGKSSYNFKLRMLKKNNGFILVNWLGIVYDTHLIGIGKDLTNIEEIKNALQLKNEILIELNHDLRTPLNGILGTISFLEEEKNKRTKNADIDLYFNILNTCSHQLLNTVNNILDYSKKLSIKSEIYKEYKDIRDIINDCIKMVTSDMRLKNIVIKTNTDKLFPFFLIDEKKMEKIIINILSNSVKYTEIGYIKILLNYQTNYENNSECDLIISIEDTGIGIEPENIKKIFNRYYRVNKKYEDNSSGLGLSIVKPLMNLLNGKITVESEINKGTKMTLIFNNILFKSIEDVRLESFIKRERGKLKIEDKEVLILDNDVVSLLILEKFLESYYSKIYPVNNYKKAMEILHTQNIKIIFLDLHMPDMDGFEFLKLFKQNFNIKDYYIIICSGETDEDIINKCYSSGANNYLVKPVFFDDILKIVSNI